MPPLPNVPGVVKVIISTSRSDSDIENIVHCGYTGGPPSAGDLLSWLTAGPQPGTEAFFNAEGSTDLVGVSIEALDLSSSSGASAIEALTIAGVRTGDFAPASAALVVSYDIARRYRGGHPRSYFPFGTAGTYEAGSSKLWDSGFVTAVHTAAATWAATFPSGVIGSTTFTGLVNVSYVDKNLNPVPPYRRTVPVVDDITGLVAKQRICSQRRRLGKLFG